MEREKSLDRYRDEIIKLCRDRRYSKERARRALEDKYGTVIPKSTFGRYTQNIPELKETPESLPPEAEHFLEQREVYETIIQGIKATTELAVQLHGRMGMLEDAAAARHKALVENIQALAQAVPVNGQNDEILTAIRAATQGLEFPDTRPALAAIHDSIRLQGRDITAIRRSVGPVWGMVQRNAPWMKAFTITGLFWLAVSGGVMWYYQLWRFLPLQAWRAALPF